MATKFNFLSPCSPLFTGSHLNEGLCTKLQDAMDVFNFESPTKGLLLLQTIPASELKPHERIVLAVI